MKRLLTAGCVLVALSVGITAHANAAQLPPVGDYPDAECTNEVGASGAGPGDIYVSPIGHFWECICEERVFTDNDCAWYDQGPINSTRNARLRRRIRRGLVRVVRFTPAPRPVAVVKTAPVATIATAPAVTTSKCNDPYLADDQWSQQHGC